MSSNGIGKSTYRAFLNGFARFFGSKNAKLFDARFRYGRRLDIEKPRTLADKISWIELNADEELMARCTDKYAVRDYVANLGAENILIPLCGGLGVASRRSTSRLSRTNSSSRPHMAAK